MTVPKLRIFISSPGDVAPERDRAEAVIKGVSATLDGITLEAVRWEGRPYSALSTFQTQIDKPSACDLVVSIFWKRLGTELPPEFNRADGTARTGTEFEFEEAMGAAKGREPPVPDILVFKKTAAITYTEERVDQERAEKRALDAFWSRWFRSAEGHFLAAFDSFTTPDQFARVFERALRGWIDERFRRTDWDIATQGSPFRGLETFDEAHGAVFFGRRRAVEQARAQMLATAERGFPALFLMGASGVGKSSLARAGLLPRLMRPLGAAPMMDQFRRAETLPGLWEGKPARGLARALFAAIPEIAQGDYRDAAALERLFETAPDMADTPIVAALDRWAAALQEAEQADAPPRTGAILLIDQLEQSFALPTEARALTARLLTRLAQTGRVWLVLTLRSDLYGSLQGDAPLFALKAQGATFDVLPPSPADIREMIEGPARAAGLTYQSVGGVSLAEALERDAGKEPGALPLLQFALKELFAKRTNEGLMTLEVYDKLGGVAGALAVTADAAIAAEPAEVQGALREVLGQLAHVDLAAKEVKDIARPIPQAAFPPGSPARRLADVLVAQRLILADGGADGATLRVAHENLFEKWPAAKTLLAADRQARDLRSQLERQAKAWGAAEAGKAKRDLLLERAALANAVQLRKDRPDLVERAVDAFIQASERAAQFRGRMILGGAAALVALFAGIAAYAWQQNSLAQYNLQTAINTANSLLFDVSGKLDPQRAVVTPELKAELEAKIRALIAELSKGQTLSSGGERTRMVSLNQEGETYQLRGDLENARKNFETALEIARRLAKSFGTPESLRDVSVSLNNVARIDQAQGDLKSARTGFAEMLEITRQLAKSLGTQESLRDLSYSLQFVATIDQAQGDLKSARTGFAESLGIRRQLAKSLGTPQSLRDVSASLDAIARIDQAQGDLKSART
ncbi:MAG TPA: hypothetical protein DCL54_15415, partial [Alphaproteobacteria bacterium]|nr:hypothetical protein [Alphaproteobacteria bacterium]